MRLVGSIPMHFRHFYARRVAGSGTTRPHLARHHGLMTVALPCWRIGATGCVRLLRRIMHHLCTAFCTGCDCPLIVVVGNLEVVFLCDLLSSGYD